jgi:hypothetical protein
MLAQICFHQGERSLLYRASATQVAAPLFSLPLMINHPVRNSPPPPQWGPLGKGVAILLL